MMKFDKDILILPSCWPGSLFAGPNCKKVNHFSYGVLILLTYEGFFLISLASKWFALELQIISVLSETLVAIPEKERLIL